LFLEFEPGSEQDARAHHDHVYALDWEGFGRIYSPNGRGGTVANAIGRIGCHAPNVGVEVPISEEHIRCGCGEVLCYTDAPDPHLRRRHTIDGCEARRVGGWSEVATDRGAARGKVSGPVVGLSDLTVDRRATVAEPVLRYAELHQPLVPGLFMRGGLTPVATRRTDDVSAKVGMVVMTLHEQAGRHVHT